MRRRGGSPGDGLVEVELVDVPEERADRRDADGVVRRVPQGEPPGGTADPVTPPPRRRRRSRPVVAAVGLGLTVAVVANVAEAREEAARRAARAETPGILAPMDGPLAVTWEHAGMFSGTTDTLVLVSDGSDLDAVDPETGAVVWTREEAGSEYCSPVGAGYLELETFWQSRTLIEVEGPELLACAAWESQGYNGANSFGEVGTDIVDAATGEMLRRLSTFGAAVLNEPFGAHLLIAVVTREGTVTLQRWDPATGELLAEVASAEQVSTGGSGIVRRVERFGDVLVVKGDADAAFDLRTGKEVDPLATVEEDRWRSSMPLPDGSSAVWTYAQTGLGSGAVVEPDGTERFPLPGPPAEPWATDRSLPEILLVTNSTNNLVALDVATGEQLWSTAHAGVQVSALVDGRLIVRQGSLLLTLDGRDGTALWTTRPLSAVWAEGLTDGELLLVYEGSDEGRELVARRLADGEVRWRTKLPLSTQMLQPILSGQIIGTTQDSVFGIGAGAP